MRKITLLIGAGIGYVLGTRAGREQYDRMAAEARKLWRDPRVQQKAQQAQDTASDLGHKAESKVSEKVDRSSSGSASSEAAAPSTFPTSAEGTSTGDFRA